MLAEHAVLMEGGRRGRRRRAEPRRLVQPVAFQFGPADVGGRRLEAAGPWLRHRKRVWGFCFGMGGRARGFLRGVTGRGSVGCPGVALVDSSAPVGQPPRVVPLEARVAGRVADHLAGARLLLDGEPEGPPGAGAVRLQARGPVGQSGPRRRRGGAAGGASAVGGGR